MQRVLVVGCSGAGKSTFSRRLAEVTGLPRIELDREFWQPGWRTTPREIWLPKVEAFCAESRWILDGNFNSSLHIRVPRADSVLWLDYPRHVCIRRVLARWLRNYRRVRPGFAAGCPEKVDWPFLRYVWNFNEDHGRRLAAMIEERGRHLCVHRFKSDREADRFLRDLEDNAQGIVAGANDR
jgi:adenylate kinase family enzyme